MAKEKPKVKEIFAEIAKKVGLPEDQAKAFLATLDNEQLEAALGETVMSRSDYSRAQDEVRKVREQAEAEKAMYEETYGKNLLWYQQNEASLKAYPGLQAQVEAYRKLYGDLENPNPNPNLNPEPTNGNGKFVSREDLNKGMQEVWQLNEQLMEAQEHYFTTFKTPFPVAKYKELKTTAMKPENSGRPFRDVYKDFINGEVEERRAAEHAAEVTKAREEGIKEGLAKRSFPDETGQGGTEEVSPLYLKRPENSEPDEIALRQNFLRGLQETSP